MTDAFMPQVRPKTWNSGRHPMITSPGPAVNSVVVATSAFGLGVASMVSCICSHEYNCTDHNLAMQSRELAGMAFKGGNFGQAKTLYMNAVEQCSDNYDARIGLANACRAYGIELFKSCDQMARQGKLQQAKKMFDDAWDDNHKLAEKLYSETQGGAQPEGGGAGPAAAGEAKGGPKQGDEHVIDADFEVKK